MRNSGYKEDISQLEEINRQKDDFSTLHALINTIDKLYGLKRRIEVFDGAEPFARELGVTFSGTDPHKKKGEIVTTHFSNMKRGQYLDTAAAYLAWLSYQHPKEAREYCSEVGLKFRQYTGHPLAPKEAIIEVKSPATKSLLYTLDINPLSKFVSHVLHETFPVSHWKRRVVVACVGVTLMALTALSYLAWQEEKNFQQIGEKIDRNELKRGESHKRLEDNLSQTLSQLYEQVAAENTGCLGDIARYLANANDNAHMEIDAACKSTLYAELAKSEYFYNINHETRYELITALIETAQKSSEFDSAELGILFLFRALYGIHHNTTKAFEDYQTAYSLNPNLTLAYTSAIKSYPILSWKKKIPNLEEADIFSAYSDIFTWQVSEEPLLRYYQLVGSGRSRSATSDELISAFNKITNDKSFFGIETSISIAAGLERYYKDSSLIERFVSVHGTCDLLIHTQNRGNCYQMLYIQKVNEKDIRNAREYYDKAVFHFQKAKAFNSEAQLLLLRQQLGGDYYGLPNELKRYPTTEKVEFLKHINQAKENDDLLLQGVLLYVYGKDIVGFLLQDHEQALEIISQSVDLLEDYLRPEVLRNIKYKNIWREFQFGDKFVAIQYMQEKHDNTVFENEIAKAASLQDLSSYYRQVNETIKSDALLADATAIYKNAVDTTNDYQELANLSKTLNSRYFFDLSYIALKKIKNFRPNSSDAQEHRYAVLTTEFGLYRAYYEASKRGFVQLDKSNTKRILNSMHSIAAEVIRKDENGEYLFKDYEGFYYYLSAVEDYEDRLIELNLSKKQIFENSILDATEGDGTDILEAAKKRFSYLQSKYGEDGGKLSEFWSPYGKAYNYIEEYFEQFQTWYGIEDETGPIQKFVRPTLLPDHSKSLEAAYIDWKFGYSKDQPFGSSAEALVLIALTADLIGEKEASKSYVEDAFDMIEGRVGAHRKHAFQRMRDAQAILMHTQNIADTCNYLEALKILDKHKPIFSVMIDVWSAHRRNIFKQSEDGCSK